jgi:hypothetical protein
MSSQDPVSALYRLPLADFTAARNNLAKELRSGGDREGAEEVKRLGKPSVSAWAVNQLYWERPETFEEFLGAGSAQRKAVQSGGSALRSAAERKRQLQGELLKSAEEILGRQGTLLSQALRQRVSRTLDTLAAWPPESEAPALGRLTHDLEPVGFDVLLGAPIARRARAGPSPSGKKHLSAPKAKSGAARRRLKEAESALAEAERSLKEVRRAERSARGKLNRAESRAEKALERAKRAELEAEKARDLADAAQLVLRKTRAARDLAVQTTERHEASVDSAKSRLAELA